MSKLTHIIAGNGATPELCKSGRKIKSFNILVIVIFCLFGISNIAFAQEDAYEKAEVAQKTKWESFNARYNNPAYIIDEKLVKDSESKQIVDNLDPYAVVKITVVRGATHRERNAVYIITDLDKISAYQKKLAAFSKEYTNYLEVNHNRDALFHYFIDGVMLKGFRPAIIQKLFEIPAQSIKDVELKLKNSTNGNINRVFITTKQ
ncbi:MAG: TonB-dependent outer rane receptor, SusC/RagA subfamily, signature region [Mucilaginibacter sp.]|nr:TonB-dependent outer rane receptor, SusC/RagA subfamily, signature region [Mucilaginibacter sp.]